MKSITMYCSKDSPRCDEARKFLGEKGYKYIEKDIKTDKVAQQELRDMYVSGFPSFIIGNEIIEGFDVKRIEKAMCE